MIWEQESEIFHRLLGEGPCLPTHLAKQRKNQRCLDKLAVLSSKEGITQQTKGCSRASTLIKAITVSYGKEGLGSKVVTWVTFKQGVGMPHTGDAGRKSTSTWKSHLQEAHTNAIVCRVRLAPLHSSKN